MFISFTVGNFRSFREPVTLNLAAAHLSSRNLQVDENATIPIHPDLSLLTSVGIYGANASGKSNLVRGLVFMRNFVSTSSKESQANEPINIVPYRLSTATENQPSFFEVVFLVDATPYRYGFEVNHQRVVSEWLFYAPTRKETRLFVREGNEFKIGRSFKGASGLSERTRPNALFLSVAAQFNVPIASVVLGWFRDLKVISGLSDNNYRDFAIETFVSGEYRDEVAHLIHDLDTGIREISAENISLADLTDRPVHIKTLHPKYAADGTPAGSEMLDMDDESEGTQKLFLLAAPILDTLANGYVLIVDEMEARLHTLITRALVGLFNSRETNPKHAQLIFTTHDTNLLDRKLLRRDQIWFIEKDRQGASHLYSLAELKIRNDASFENDYLQGRYGAIPLLGSLREITLEEPVEFPPGCSTQVPA